MVPTRLHFWKRRPATPDRVSHQGAKNVTKHHVPLNEMGAPVYGVRTISKQGRSSKEAKLFIHPVRKNRYPTSQDPSHRAGTFLEFRHAYYRGDIKGQWLLSGGRTEVQLRR